MRTKNSEMSKQVPIEALEAVLRWKGGCPDTIPGYMGGWQPRCDALAAELGYTLKNDPIGDRTCRECMRREVMKIATKESVEDGND